MLVIFLILGSSVKSFDAIMYGMHFTVLSWTTIVVHSRYGQEVGVVHEVKSPENQPQFFLTTMGQYWLN